jgi:phosphatidylglycerol:prolipoprotein diacylglycerol transferase
VPVIQDPVAFDILGLPIRWYGLFMLTAIFAGLWTVRHLAARVGLDPEFALDAAPIVILAAVIGARLYYLALRQDYYRRNPDELLSLQLQGLTIHGALVAGIATFAWLCRRRGQPFLRWADVVIAALPISQAIGRWGNWANQEAFGRPTSLPWAVTIDPARRPAEFAEFETFHPTFLYEGILNLLIASVLIWLLLRPPRALSLRPGDLLGIYLILYGVVRLAIESMRTDSLTIGPWPAAYWLSAALIVAGAAMLAVRRIAPGFDRDAPAATRAGVSE